MVFQETIQVRCLRSLSHCPQKRGLGSPATVPRFTDAPRSRPTIPSRSYWQGEMSYEKTTTAAESTQYGKVDKKTYCEPTMQDGLLK